MIATEEFLANIPEFQIEPGAQITASLGMLMQIHEVPLVWTPERP